MNTYNLTIDLLGYWHVGSGHGVKADIDALVLKNEHGFPYLPGRTVKGLLRDAVLDMNLFDAADRLFGKAAEKGQNHGSVPGVLAFDNAGLSREEREWILSSPDADGLKAQLFDSVASTAIDQHGLASTKTLRLIEVTLPMTLHGTVTHTRFPADEEQDLALLTRACGVVRALGSHRHRGLGRCRFTLETTA